jgi:Holliday junction resolvase RusA-like endonuclease
MQITFWVPGIPAPGGSKNAFPIKKGGVYTGRVAVVDAGGKKTKAWRAAVSQCAKEAMQSNPPLEGPLRIYADFVMPRPKYHFNQKGIKQDAPYFHIVAADIGKLARSTDDAMTGIVYKDDAQLCETRTCKHYGNRPGCMITVETCQKLKGLRYE